jgi:S-DNA-T family DNA segregation ATPase FtsK/SpoIIIE
MGEVNVGPTVTQYTLKPAEGVKLSRITALANDLALALASHPIRIEAPIPGKSLVGIEVPNKVRTLVRLRNLISEPQFQKHPSPLYFVLGRDVSGNPVFADLAKMPHLLVCGATGTGKTLFLNSLILSLVYRNSPKILKFILVDPKRVEFPIYSDLPHNLTNVIFDVQKTINALRWLVEEMERRFEVLAKFKTRDIFSFNKISLEKKIPPMPYILLIIDELADLMAARGKEIEAAIVRLAQMARAVGIHLVLATQRPSTEVITGLIKANITSRVSFQVASQVDSRTVLDTAGAEKLLGRGDMLFLSPENPKPRRIQGAFVSEKEVQRVVEYLSSKYEKERIESLEEKLAEETGEIGFFERGEDLEDPLYEEAKRVVIEAKKASASLLQRRLKIGYARAARLLDILEKRGIVGPPRGAKPREVYLKEEEEWEKV